MNDVGVPKGMNSAALHFSNLLLNQDGWVLFDDTFVTPFLPIADIPIPLSLRRPSYVHGSHRTAVRPPRLIE